MRQNTYVGRHRQVGQREGAVRVVGRASRSMPVIAVATAGVLAGTSASAHAAPLPGGGDNASGRIESAPQREFSSQALVSRAYPKILLLDRKIARANPARRVTAQPASVSRSVPRTTQRSTAPKTAKKATPAKRSPSRSTGSVKVRYQGGNRGIGRALAAQRGWSGAQFECLNKLWTKESGWTTTADNPTSSAYGIPQSLPGSKMASEGSDWRTNPATQIKWGLKYIAGRYGSPCNAWAHSRAVNWY